MHPSRVPLHFLLFGRDVGVKAIENLMERRGAFDYIVLETTGLADPGPIAGMFWLDEALCSRVQLDGQSAISCLNAGPSYHTNNEWLRLPSPPYSSGIVTVVDAKYGLEQLQEKREDGSLNEAVR